MPELEHSSHHKETTNWRHVNSCGALAAHRVTSMSQCTELTSNLNTENGIDKRENCRFPFMFARQHRCFRCLSLIPEKGTYQMVITSQFGGIDRSYRVQPILIWLDGKFHGCLHCTLCPYIIRHTIQSHSLKRATEEKYHPPVLWSKWRWPVSLAGLVDQSACRDEAPADPPASMHMSATRPHGNVCIDIESA